MQKTIVTPSGQTKEGELVDVDHADERWSEYRLTDGTFLKMKPVVTEVWRLQDEYDAEGNPQYVVKSTMVVSVVTPASLRKGLQS